MVVCQRASCLLVLTVITLYRFWLRRLGIYGGLFQCGTHLGCIGIYYVGIKYSTNSKYKKAQPFEGWAFGSSIRFPFKAYHRPFGRAFGRSLLAVRT